MKVRVETADHLVLEERPVLLAVVLSVALLGVVALAIGRAQAADWGGAGMFTLGSVVVMVAIVAFIRRTIAEFDRPAQRVTIRATTLLRTTRREFPLTEIAGAEVQTSRSGKGGPAHRPALRLRPAGAVAITPVYTSGRGAGRAVAAIERWLAGADAS